MKKKLKKKTFTSNEKLRANRALETEEQMKDRLRIGREKDRARRITQKLQEENKKSSETENHEKQHLATLKRLKRHCSTDDDLLVSNPYVHPEYNLYFTAVVPMVQLQSISGKTSVWNILFTQGLLNRFI